MALQGHPASFTRREFLRVAGVSAGLPLLSPALTQGSSGSGDARGIAAIVTEFRPNSHAEMIAGRWLEGFELDGESDRPRSKLLALYTDQVPGNDISRKLSEQHKVPIYATIREALCRGGDKLAVDGVLLIGEHGTYPVNDRGQQLYPRRRFFEETIKVLRASGRVVPVYSDKHLAANWKDASWMYEQARELKVPFMAGSSLPTTWRYPALEVEAGTDIQEALAIGYGGTEIYGFHVLEMLQCQMERRKGGETGVTAVQCLEGEAVWKAAEQKRWTRRLLDAALSAGTEKTKPGAPELNCKNPTAFLIEYKDGRHATVLLLNGHTAELLFAVQVAGQREPVATNFWLQGGRPYGHFTMLARGIDSMFVTGKPSWPVERTLLTTGILDAAMISRSEKQQRLETPALVFTYAPGPPWTLPPKPKTGPLFKQ
jgi:hypothetical protein